MAIECLFCKKTFNSWVKSFEHEVTKHDLELRALWRLLKRGNLKPHVMYSHFVIPAPLVSHEEGKILEADSKGLLNENENAASSVTAGVEN